MTPSEGIAGLVVAGAPLLAGRALLRFAGCDRRDAGFSWWGWSLAAGGIVFGAAVAAAIAFRIPRPEIAATIVALLLAFVATRFAPPAPAPAPAPDDSHSDRRRFGKIERAIFALAVALAVSAAVDRALLSRAKPVADGDELTIWVAKARVLQHADDGPAAAFGKLSGWIYSDPPLPIVLHADYPPLLPLWASAALRLHDDPEGRVARIPAHAISIGLVLALAGALRRRVRPAVAAALLGAAGTRGIEFDGLLMADRAVAFGLVVAADGCARALGSRKKSDAFVAGVGLCFAAWSKNEGAACVAALVVGAIAARLAGDRGARSLAAPLFAGVVAVWSIFALNAAAGVVNDHLADPEGESFVAHALRSGATRAGAFFSAFTKDVFFAFERTSGLFLFAPLAALAAGRRAREAPIFAAATIGPASAYALVFLGTYHDFAGHWNTAGSRIYGQLLPVAAAWIASSLAACSPFFSASGPAIGTFARKD